MSTPWNVFVSHSLPAPASELLRSRFTVDYNESYLDLNRADLISRSKSADAICSYSDQFDGALLDELPSLKIIASHWAGADDEGVAAASNHNVIMTAPPDQYRWVVSGVAELVWGLFIAAGRRFLEADAFARAGRMDHHEASNLYLLGEGLSGRTLGLIGAGNIGRAVARRSVGFEMRIVYADLKPSQELDELGATRVSLTELLTNSDFVNLSVPEDTHHLIGAAEFAAMRSTAVFVNTGRGRAVDEISLADALTRHEIAAAGVDVYENEPEISPELLAAPNVILMPHTGGALRSDRTRAAMFMAQSIVDLSEGRRPEGMLNPDIYDTSARGGN